MTSQITLSNKVNENIKDEAFDIAPNWKLVWWRFKKHRLALVSAFVLFGIILIALFPDFFSIQDPNKSSARESFMPPQGISFFHNGSFQVHVKPLKGKRNKTTLKMEWGVDEKRILPLHFFDFNAHWGLKTNIQVFNFCKGCFNALERCFMRYD